MRDPVLTLSILEIVLLCFGAIVLGITIHFTIASRRNFKLSLTDKDENSKIRDEWKLRYFNDIELKDKELLLLKEQMAQVREQLAESEENTNIYTIEAEEMRHENKRLLVELDNLRTTTLSTPTPTPTLRPAEKQDYLEQLRIAQSGLLEHDENIRQLLEHIDAFKETEEIQREMLRNNEELSMQISDLRLKLMEKEKEMSNIRQKEHLTKEMTSLLDNAYSEFNVLQSKMQKLELQVSSSKMINIEFEDLKESYHKISREFDSQKNKLDVTLTERQHLQAQLMETEDKLREANFQRQQLQKRVAYLEELNHDMQAVTDTNKKLEIQLKRIGELESMLNVVSEEKDQMMQRGLK